MSFQLFLGVIMISLVHAEPLKVFICAGQSNMKGVRTEQAQLPSELAEQSENFVFVKKGSKPGEWRALTAENNQSKGFGPELSFAKEMSAYLGEPIGIVKHSVGGTQLATRWNPDGESSLYQVLLQKFRDAQQQKEIQVIGMIWMQGEADSKNVKHAAAYKENLERFVARSRRDFSEMPFIAGRVNPPKSKKYVAPEVVRAAQETAAIQQYAYVNCDELTKVADGVHYDTTGTIELGKLFAQKMIAQLENRADK